MAEVWTCTRCEHRNPDYIMHCRECKHFRYENAGSQYVPRPGQKAFIRRIRERAKGSIEAVVYFILGYILVGGLCGGLGALGANDCPTGKWSFYPLEIFLEYELQAKLSCSIPEFGYRLVTGRQAETTGNYALGAAVISFPMVIVGIVGPGLVIVGLLVLYRKLLKA